MIPGRGMPWLLIALLLAACGRTSAVPAPATAPAPAPVAQAPASPAAQAPPPTGERPQLLLDLALAPDPGQPGASSAAAGGISPRGPTSLAVDESGLIYLWDQGRARLLVYAGGKLVRRVSLPYATPDAGRLAVQGGRLYLSTAAGPLGYELEADAASGELLAIWALGPHPLSTVYPFFRPPLSEVGKGEPQPVGEDAFRNVYHRVLPGDGGPRLVRLDRAGQLLAWAQEPEGQGDIVDRFVAPDGGTYVLTAVWDGGEVVRARVLRLLAPVGTPPAPPPRGEPGRAQVAGRPVPDWVEVRPWQQASVRLTDRADLVALWRALAVSLPRPDAPPPAPAEGYPRLVAGWSDGSRLELEVRQGEIIMAGKAYTGLTPAIQALLDYALARPERWAEALRRGGGSVSVLDLRAEALPRPLEPPFPRYALSIRPGREAGHGGDSAAATGGGADLTRWKATVVRRLLGLEPDDFSSEYPGLDRLALTFTVAGKPEVVTVTGSGFAYGGTFYPRRHLLWINQLQGVP